MVGELRTLANRWQVDWISHSRRPPLHRAILNWATGDLGRTDALFHATTDAAIGVHNGLVRLPRQPCGEVVDFEFGCVGKLPAVNELAVRHIGCQGFELY